MYTARRWPPRLASLHTHTHSLTHSLTLACTKRFVGMPKHAYGQPAAILGVGTYIGIGCGRG